MSEYRYEVVTEDEDLANAIDQLIVAHLSSIRSFDKQWDGKRAHRERY